MNKLLLSLAFIGAIGVLHAKQEEQPDESVVHHSSYIIYEGASGIVGGVPSSSKLVTFYTFDGQALKTIEHKFRFPVIERKLDQNAQKPRPTNCEVKYWPGIQLGFGMRKGEPGDFILFYDKHGNIIARERFNESPDLSYFMSRLEDFTNKLDLTDVKQKILALHTRSTELVQAKKQKILDRFFATAR